MNGKRVGRGTTLGALSLMLTLGALAPQASGAVGDLTFQGCVADLPGPGCPVPTPASLSGAGAVAVSPDGTSVYVAAFSESTITHFTRDSTGALTFQGCFADAPLPGCTVPAVAALNGALGVAVSPDGGSVYVTSLFDHAVTSFARAPSGALSFQSCFEDDAGPVIGCTVPAQPALERASGIAASPDGTSVYVVSEIDGSISHFSRAVNGTLTFQGCFADTAAEGCLVPSDPALSVAQGVAVSEDGESVYVASTGDDSISQFARAANGALTYVDCFAELPATGCKVPTQIALDGAKAVAISPEGNSVYVGSHVDGSISHFDRAPSGALTYEDCFADAPATGCAVPSSAVLDNAAHIAVSPDGSSVYIAAEDDDALSHFDRAADGSLTFRSCFVDAALPGCTVPAQAALAGAFMPRLSPDGRSLYLGSISEGSVSIFDRETLPAPTPPAPPPATTPDTTPPDTLKGKGPKKKVKTKRKQAKVTFEFSASEVGATFECSLDGQPFAACQSPAKAKVKAKPRAKKHSFEARAIDAAGNADATPARFQFKTVRLARD